MKRLTNWAVLIFLGIICVYDAMILYGLEEVQLGPKPTGLNMGLATLICHVGGLAVCYFWRRVGLMSMILLGALGWLFYLAFLLQDDQHHSIGAALEYSVPSIAYVLLSVTFALRNWIRSDTDHLPS